MPYSTRGAGAAAQAAHSHSTTAPHHERREIRFREHDGRRSTTAAARTILAEAARAADTRLAERIESSREWRKDYIPFVRELTVLADDPTTALGIADAGLAAMRRELIAEDRSGQVELGAALDASPKRPLPATEEVAGSAGAVRRLEVPYRGRTLHGDDLSAQLDRWVRAGTVEPSFAIAIELVAQNPDWLSLPGRTVALIGAGSEIGPLQPLCAWGADVLAIDLPDERVWSRVRREAQQGAGRLRMPLDRDSDCSPGLDLLADLGSVRDWLHANLAGSTRPVLGMYCYADGGEHVLLSGAFDVLAGDLAARLPDLALAYLATPTDAYLVPAGAVERARRAYRARRVRRLAQAPAQLLSGGRLYKAAYTSGVPVADVLIEQQGPNYALAKRLQRWRGVTAQATGAGISFNVAPATWTRSVTKNRILAAAYAGARHFGIEIFEPATTRVLMAAMLVHDLNRETPATRQPEDLFSHGAAHGGLWTAAYEPRSALGLAALAGLPATLRSRAKEAA